MVGSRPCFLQGSGYILGARKATSLEKIDTDRHCLNRKGLVDITAGRDDRNGIDRHWVSVVVL